jgi:ligand-binding sensor domain-containing protein
MLVDSRISWRSIALLLACGVLQAQPRPEQALAEMDHQVWTARDGAPQTIRALARAADGTLWIGSDSGLFNFDGRTFAPFLSPAGEPDFPVDAVSSLLAARDGTLWVGFFDAGVAHIGPGRVTLYTNAGDHRLRVIKDLREARDGSIWGSSAQARIVRFGLDRQWREEPTPLSTGERLFAVLDSADTLWVSQRNRLYRRDVSESRYTPTEVGADWMFGFAEEPDGTFWIADFDGAGSGPRLQHIDRRGKLIARVASADMAPNQIAYRPDGSLVYASQFDGLHLFSRQSLTDAASKRLRPEAFTREQGLSSNAVRALLRDADGTLWVGSNAGLDRFRRSLFRAFDRTAGDWRVCANRQGEVWAGNNADDQVFMIAGGKTKVLPGLSTGGVSNLFCGDDGVTWLVNRTGVWKVQNEQATAVAPVAGQASYSLGGVVTTSTQTLFAKVGQGSGRAAGIWQYEHGRWTQFTSPVLLGKSNLVMYVDRQDRLWAGLRDEVGMPTLTGGETFAAPGMGLVIALLETRHGFFAAGSGGLAVLRGSRFERLSFEDGAFTRALSGLVEARNGDLWLNAARGVVRVPASELQAALATPGYRMKSEVVTEGDFVGLTVTNYGYASTARDADGRLWFASRSGLFHFDPEQHTAEIAPPTLSIRSIAADRTPLGTARTIAPRPQTLEIRYFGAHLTDPDRVTYKYRLAGLEDGWQDAGKRTQALYTRLGPGTYVFHVMASSDNAVWTPPVSSEPFVVLPSFYQTTWFRLLCLLAGVALVAAVLTLRVRAITRTVRARAEERADERIRIARELHDTLLQGVQGLLLNFHVAAQKIAPDDASKAMLETTLATADRIIVEGRNRVSSLRSEHLTDGELVA